MDLEPVPNENFILIESGTGSEGAIYFFYLMMEPVSPKPA